MGLGGRGYAPPERQGRISGLPRFQKKPRGWHSPVRFPTDPPNPNIKNGQQSEDEHKNVYCLLELLEKQQKYNHTITIGRSQLFSYVFRKSL